MTTLSSFLNLLEPKDVVLADKGFPQIKTFLHGDCFSAEEVQETQKIASIRIHVERIIQTLKTFQILSKLTGAMLPYVNEIAFMCCALVNLQPHIIKNEDCEHEDCENEDCVNEDCVNEDGKE